jgi:hypothetical protein
MQGDIQMRLLICAVIAACLAPAVNAETWVCEFEVGKRQQLIPQKVTFTFGEYVQTIKVVDTIAAKHGKKASRGEVSGDNAKRRSVKWKINGLPTQRTPQRSFAYHGIEFRGAVLKNSKKSSLEAYALPNKYYQPYHENARGRCKTGN